MLRVDCVWEGALLYCTSYFGTYRFGYVAILWLKWLTRGQHCLGTDFTATTRNSLELLGAIHKTGKGLCILTLYRKLQHIPIAYNLNKQHNVL